MITKETYQDLVLAGASVAKSLYLVKALESSMTADVDESTMVITDVYGDESFGKYSDAVDKVASDINLYDAIETLTNIAMSLECEYAYSQELKMAYLNSISAVAFDGERGKHYAKLMLEFITTGEGEAELYALESDMDNDAIWWVRNNT